MIYSDYNERRQILAGQCADALGIKEIPAELRELAIQKCDIPANIHDNGMAVAERENSLLSMGVVYCYGSTLNFIARDGHTCILPYNEITARELEKCGYVACAYGESSPKLDYKRDQYGHIDIMADNYYDVCEKEKTLREKCTLPKELAEAVCSAESRGNLDFLEAQEKSGLVARFPYDVFSHRLYRGHDYGHAFIEQAVEFLGYDNLTARKLLAFTGHGEVSLSHPYSNVTDLDSYLAYVSNNKFLNDSKYFAPGGFYNQVTSETLKKR